MAEDIDVTILTDKLPDPKWKCPHCGKQNKMGPAAEEIIEEHFKYLEECHWCGYVHYWELHLSEKFKKKVLELFSV